MSEFPQGTEAAVCADIARRQKMGVTKYGVSVADNPLELKQWVQHAYEECLDQAIYLKRILVKLDSSTVGISEEDRQLTVLSLALCSLLRPGFEHACRQAAIQFKGESMYDEFRKCNQDVVKPAINGLDMSDINKELET